MEFIQMYNRKTLEHISSSKSISTSTTLRPRSPSIQLQQPRTPQLPFSYKSPSFLDTNIESLTTLKHLIANEQDIVDYHKEWCSTVCNKIQTLFCSISSHINNVLTQQKINMKNAVEKDYCQFLQFMKEVKSQIKEFYNCKEQPQSEKIMAMTKKYQRQNSQYISGQNLKIRDSYQQENRERQQFRNLNHFYRSKQEILLQLSSQAEQHLRFRQRLQQKSQHFQYLLSRFQQTIDYSINTMVQHCHSYLQRDCIVQ